MRILLFLAALTAALPAQISLPAERRTNGKDVQEAFVRFREPLTASTVAFYDRNHNKGRTHRFLGTIVDAGGLVLTKASNLSEEGEYFVRIGSRKYEAVVEVARLGEWDVAMFRVDAEKGDFVVPDFFPVADVPQGSWVVQAGAVTRRGMRTRVGVLSGNIRKIGPAPSTLGVLPAEEQNGLEVGEVHEEGGAHAAGILKGDIILQIGEEKVVSLQELYDELQKTAPGELVRVLVSREGEELEFEVEVKSQLDVFGDRKDRNDMMSGRYSLRRYDFPEVFQYDVFTSPRSIGGPVYDLEGRCLGMSIARVDRVTTVGIPSERIAEIVQQLQEKMIEGEDAE